jgi:opacity protein-like surface antigen
MPHLCRTLGIAAVMSASLASAVAAQDIRPSAYGAAGFGSVFRVEDQRFGTKLNLAVGAGIEWKRLGLDAEAHRTIGLTPRDAACGIVGVPCIGSAREGVLQATMVSANASYLFGGPRVRPYVVGSIGVLRSESVTSLTMVSSTVATMSELRRKDSGLAIGVGAGVDVSIAPRLSLRPEFRTYSSTLMSRANLSLHRGSLALRYRW